MMSARLSDCANGGRHASTRADRRALDALPREAREVLVLRAVEELSYQEIALTLGVPIGTVMSRLARARQRMQAALRQELRDAG